MEIYLHFTSHMLSIFNKYVRVLEGNAVTIVDIFNIMQNLKEEIIQREKDLFFGYETNKRLKKLEQEFPDKFPLTKRNLLLFLTKSQDYLNKWFDYSETNWLNFLKDFRLCSKLEFSKVEKLLEILDIAEKLKINFNNLYSELNQINKVLDIVLADQKFSAKSSVEKWQEVFLINDSEMPNILKIVSFLFSIPATSAFTERIFSVMKTKWRDERNRATLNLIKCELMVFFNLKIDCNEAYERFLKNKNVIIKAQSSKKYSFNK